MPQRLSSLVARQEYPGQSSAPPGLVVIIVTTTIPYISETPITTTFTNFPIIPTLQTALTPSPTAGLLSTAPVPTTSASLRYSTSTSKLTVPTSVIVGASSIPTSSLSTAAKLGVDVGASLGTIIVFLLAAILWRQEQRQKKQKSAGLGQMKEQKKRHRKWMPYLQHKGELDAEEQARNEMEAADILRELEAEERHELPGKQARPKSRSSECAQELEVPRENHDGRVQ